MVYSLVSILPSLEDEGCYRTRRYYHILLFTPVASLLLSAWLAYRDSEPKLVWEKAFYFRLFLWPYVDGETWYERATRGFPRNFVWVTMLAVTLLMLFDESVSAHCYGVAAASKYTLVKAASVSSGINILFAIFGGV
jgi:hypothetical protein